MYIRILIDSPTVRQEETGQFFWTDAVRRRALCGRCVIYGACSAAHVIGRVFYGPQNAQPRIGKTQPKYLQVLTKRGRLHPRFDACYVAEIGHVRSKGRQGATVELGSYRAEGKAR